MFQFILFFSVNFVCLIGKSPYKEPSDMSVNHENGAFGLLANSIALVLFK